MDFNNNFLRKWAVCQRFVVRWRKVAKALIIVWPWPSLTCGSRFWSTRKTRTGTSRTLCVRWRIGGNYFVKQLFGMFCYIFVCQLSYLKSLKKLFQFYILIFYWLRYYELFSATTHYTIFWIMVKFPVSFDILGSDIVRDTWPTPNHTIRRWSATKRLLFGWWTKVFSIFYFKLNFGISFRNVRFYVHSYAVDSDYRPWIGAS